MSEAERKARAYVRYKGLIAKQDAVLAALQIHHPLPELIDAVLDVRYELILLRDAAYSDTVAAQQTKG